MTTLEKVARAIKTGRGCDADDIHCSFCLWGPDERTKEWDETGCMWLARAAIEALKNLDVLDRAWQKMESKSDNWNSALDAILNEK